MRTVWKPMIVAAAIAAVPFDGMAQSTQPPATPPAQPGSSATIPEKTQASPGTDGSSTNLTDKLKDTSGVIKPPADVDPAMAKQAPATQGTMPVIKPPEEKGGPTAK